MFESPEPPGAARRGSRRRSLRRLAAAGALAASLGVTGVVPAAAAAAPLTSSSAVSVADQVPVKVIVRHAGGSTAAALAVETLGGTVQHRLDVIDGVSALVSPLAARILADDPAAMVSLDGGIEPMSNQDSASAEVSAAQQEAEQARIEADRARYDAELALTDSAAATQARVDADADLATAQAALTSAREAEDLALQAKQQAATEARRAQGTDSEAAKRAAYHDASEAHTQAKAATAAARDAVTTAESALTAARQAETDAIAAARHAETHAVEAEAIAVELETRADNVELEELRSLNKIRKHIRADRFANAGYTGAGIDVALIDSGITPVPGIDDPGQVVNGPDLSFDAGAEGMRHLDAYGHGTHLAGIINGTEDANGAAGIAPGSRIVNLKVADATGATDVSQVIAAIDWVVQHRNADGLNIRVLALAYGTDGISTPMLDPLVASVQAAWNAGIVVVVAAGNHGEVRTGMANPAIDQYVLAVGAVDPGESITTEDDVVPEWSPRRDDVRGVDFVTPGTSVVSFRVPGSYIDQNYGSTGAIGEHGFKGTGTSQAAAVTAAGVALMLEARPHLTPDAIKYGLINGAVDTPAHADADGAGLIDLAQALRQATNATAAAVEQRHALSSAAGSLDLSRGTHQVVYVDENGEKQVIDGDETAFGISWEKLQQERPWMTGSWSGASWSGASWSGASWSGASWSGASWSGASWSGASWSGASWSGASWSGASWSANSWHGVSWN